MTSRWVAILACLLYMSVSTLFAAGHTHDEDSAAGDRCAACVWHYTAQVDLPQAHISVAPACILIAGPSSTPVSLSDPSIGSHPSRGPPTASF